MGLLRKVAIGGVLLFALYKGCSCGYDKINAYTEGGTEETLQKTTRYVGKYVKQLGECMENAGAGEENNKQEPSELEKKLESGIPNSRNEVSRNPE